MNTLMIWATAALVVFLLSVGLTIVGIRWLTRSLIKNITDIENVSIDVSKIKKVLHRVMYLYFFILVVGLLPWSTAVSTAGAMADQYFRNTVNELMSLPDLFSSISLSPNEYKSLPYYWRQALAEIALRPDESAAEVKDLARGLTMEDVELINLLAPYAVNGSIIRDDDRLSEHLMPELSYRQFLHLESVGVIEDISSGMRTTIKKGETEHPLKVKLIGSTLNLIGIGDGSESDVILNYSPLTRGGRQLIEALQVPSNGAYFEWVARKLEEQGVRTEIRVTGVLKNGMSESRVMQAQIVRTPNSKWPDPQ